MDIESSLWLSTLLHGVEIALPEVTGIGVTMVAGGNIVAGLAAETGVKWVMEQVRDEPSTGLEAVNDFATPTVTEFLAAMTALAAVGPLVGVVVQGVLGWPLRSDPAPELQADRALDQELRGLLRPEPVPTPEAPVAEPKVPPPVLPPPTPPTMGL